MSNPKPRRVTLRNVAQRCGVSYQTVSRVINDHPYVAEETRQRVLRVIEELGYRPNRVAQSLVTNRSQTLATIAFGMDYYGPAQMVINIEHAAKAAGYDLLFASVSDTSVEQIRAAINGLGGLQVDGVLLITPVAGITDTEMEDLHPTIPIVQVDPQPGSSLPSVMIDQGFGSRLITQHLIELGHTRIDGITGPLDWFGAVARHKSWLETLQSAGIAPGKSIQADWTAAGGYDAACRLLDDGVDFTALVISNDQMALGAMRALRERGLRIPDDVSVVGFDDIPEAAYFEPPLTTIRQDFAALGKKGVEYLIERIEDPDTQIEQHVIYPELVERLSAAPLKQ